MAGVSSGRDARGREVSLPLSLLKVYNRLRYKAAMPSTCNCSETGGLQMLPLCVGLRKCTVVIAGGGLPSLTGCDQVSFIWYQVSHVTHSSTQDNISIRLAHV